MGNSEASCLLAIKVQPRAKNNTVRGRLPDGRIKISLTSPPVDGKANLALIAFLSDELQLPKNAIVIKSGFTSREKRVFVDGLDEERVLKMLNLGDNN